MKHRHCAVDLSHCLFSLPSCKYHVRTSFKVKKTLKLLLRVAKNYFRVSLRSKLFCGFSEQRKTEERDFDNFAAQEMGTSEKIERAGRGEGIMEQKME